MVHNIKKILLVLIITIPLLLVFISLLTLYTTNPIGNDQISLLDNFAFKQLLFVLLGIILFLLIYSIDLDYLMFSLPQAIMYLGTILVLIAVLFAPQEIAGTHRWFHIGSFTLQPSEFAKPIYILWTAFLLTKTRIPLLKKILVFIGSSLFLIALIFLEPDAGTTIFFLTLGTVLFTLWMLKYKEFRKALLGLILTWLVVLFVLVTKLYLLLALLVFIPILIVKSRYSLLIWGVINFSIIFLIISSILAWKLDIIKPYQKQRVQPFITAYKKNGIKGILTTSNEDKENFHTTQSKIAIGSAGISGKGPWQGTQTRLRFLPEYSTDFIYAAFSEEFGLLGATFILFTYAILILSIYLTALIEDKEHNILILSAVALTLSLEIFINIGMNLGILPTKGMPLPFLSYGGSAMLTNFILLGIVANIARNRSRQTR